MPLPAWPVLDPLRRLAAAAPGTDEAKLRTVSARQARNRVAHALREAAAIIPAELLLVETDAPFLTPHPYRGAPNEPYCLPYTVRALAELVGRPAETIARDSAATARRVYGSVEEPFCPPVVGVRCALAALRAARRRFLFWLRA